MSVDPLAAEGFSAGAAAYERARPGYPAAAVDWVCAALGLGSSSRVLDVGAGTGKLTRAFVGRVGSVAAVEPLDAMRAELSRAVPSAEALTGVAESLPVESASVDAVAVGEAFHWFDLEPALAEFRRVLAPGGGLAVLWNRPGEELPAWARELEEIVERHRDARDHPWKHREVGTFDERMHDRSDWEPLRSERFEHLETLPRAVMVDRVASMSFIAALPDDARAAALADADAMLARRGLDEVTFRVRCEAHVTRPR